jgi:predicted CoA-binding protein
MDHTQPYSDAYLQGILKSVKTIAMVGASPDKTKFSYGVLRVLSETGYDMIRSIRVRALRTSEA